VRRMILAVLVLINGCPAISPQSVISATIMNPHNNRTRQMVRRSGTATTHPDTMPQEQITRNCATCAPN